VERESLDKLIVSAIRTHSENKSLSLEYDPFAYQDLLMWGWSPVHSWRQILNQISDHGFEHAGNW
jgi:lipid II:glycine glycyltransferase (peptidoglycan interpeptide bridge formation enzyme)